MILGHRDIQTTLRYAHLMPGHLQKAVNRESLSRTITKTVTGSVDETACEVLMSPEAVEGTEERVWLGDKDSNLGSQIQSLTSYH